VLSIYLPIDIKVLVVTRKPILLVDESHDSLKAIELLKSLHIDYVEYDIRKFEESCCGELATTKAPSLFAVEGIFKGLEKINEYISFKSADSGCDGESGSAYW
jgi:hypothetical protein